MCLRHRGNAGLRVFRQAGELPAEWDALLPAGHFLLRESLALYERCSLPDIDYQYVLVYEGDRPVAAAYFQQLRIRREHVSNEALQSWRGPLWKVFTAGFRPVLLVAGHLFRHDVRTFYALPEVAPFQAYGYYRSAVDEALARSCAHAVLLKDPPEQMQTYFQQFAPEYLLLRNDVSMQMELPEAWQSFADYEKALKHKYAQRTRKVRSQAAGLELRLLDVAETEQRREELFALYRQVTERQQVRLGYLSAGLLPELLRQNPQTLRVWGFFEEDKLVAFASAWVREEVFDMFYIGFDYSRNAALQLYFNILFFALEQAIVLKKKKLVLGRTALEAKARLGCRPHYLQTYLHIRNRTLRNWIARMQQRMMISEGEWENRHPFKGE